MQSKNTWKPTGVRTEQPKVQKHAQPANLWPKSKQNGRETLMERLSSNQMCKKACTTSKRAANKKAKRKENHAGAPTEQPKV